MVHVWYWTTQQNNRMVHGTCIVLDYTTKCIYFRFCSVILGSVDNWALFNHNILLNMVTKKILPLNIYHL